MKVLTTTSVVVVVGSLRSDDDDDGSISHRHICGKATFEEGSSSLPPHTQTCPQLVNNVTRFRSVTMLDDIIANINIIIGLVFVIYYIYYQHPQPPSSPPLNSC